MPRFNAKDNYIPVLYYNEQVLYESLRVFQVFPIKFRQVRVQTRKILFEHKFTLKVISLQNTETIPTNLRSLRQKKRVGARSICPLGVNILFQNVKRIDFALQ